MTASKNGGSASATEDIDEDCAPAKSTTRTISRPKLRTPQALSMFPTPSVLRSKHLLVNSSLRLMLPRLSSHFSAFVLATWLDQLQHETSVLMAFHQTGTGAVCRHR